MNDNQEVYIVWNKLLDDIECLAFWLKPEGANKYVNLNSSYHRPLNVKTVSYEEMQEIMQHAKRKNNSS